MRMCEETTVLFWWSAGAGMFIHHCFDPKYLDVVVVDGLLAIQSGASMSMLCFTGLALDKVEHSPKMRLSSRVHS